MRYLGLVLCLMVAGCASVPMAPQALDQRAKQYEAPANTGKIYVLRRGNPIGMAYAYNIFLNGQLKAGLTSSEGGTYWTGEIEPGKYTLTASVTGYQDSVQTEINPGDIRFFKATPSIANGVSLKEIESQKAKEMLEHCRLVQGVTASQ